jgi:hypothetical protein
MAVLRTIAAESAIFVLLNIVISYWSGGRHSEADRTIDGLADMPAALGRRTRWRSGWTKEKTAKRLCYSRRSTTTASFQITFS